MKDCQTNIPRHRIRHQTKHNGGIDRNIDHTHYHCRGPLPGGADADGVGPKPPPPVVALPRSAILVSQEWQTTIAGWTFASRPKPGLQDSTCENKVYPARADKSYVLSMKNGLPYLNKELFWMAMKDIAKKASLISGHTCDNLKEMIDSRTKEPQPQIYSVKTVAIPEPPNVVFTTTPHTHYGDMMSVSWIDWAAGAATIHVWALGTGCCYFVGFDTANLT